MIHFPQHINGKTPDQMNPDEFEEYLGLADKNLQGVAAGNYANNEFYYTEPQKESSSSVVDRILEAEYQNAEESYSHAPIVSANHLQEMIENDPITQDANAEAAGPSSIFDSFDQEEQRLVEQLSAAESKPSTQKGSKQGTSKYGDVIGAGSSQIGKNRFTQKVNLKEFQSAVNPKTSSRKDYINANKSAAVTK